uniref:Coiled-coil domain containing 9 n=2 Tax=Poecilia latipinna TaxID=48699 RepID=A0A3B3TLK1_9TELE
SSAVDLKTKEEKDAELDKRIEALRKKNEALVKRYQEIEEDKKKAEQEGIAVTTPRKPRTHEPEADRRKTEKENLTVTVDLSKPAGDKRVVNDWKPSTPRGRKKSEESDSPKGQSDGRSPPRRTGSGRVGRGGQRGGGEGGGRQERRDRETRTPREGESAEPGGQGRRGGRRGGRGGRGGGGGREGGAGSGGGDEGTPGGLDRKSKEWEEKRRQNIEKMNEEMERIAEYERGQRVDGDKPIRNFLDDPRRSGPAPDIDRKEGSRRHVRNWGGLDFDNVKTGHELEREWTSRRPGPKGGSVDMTMSMTGRERAEYLRWKKEREQIDEERLARHRNATGQWRREWDAQKTDSM